jgi:hypothetical protein
VPVNHEAASLARQTAGKEAELERLKAQKKLKEYDEDAKAAARLWRRLRSKRRGKRRRMWKRS